MNYKNGPMTSIEYNQVIWISLVSELQAYSLFPLSDFIVEIVKAAWISYR